MTPTDATVPVTLGRALDEASQTLREAGIEAARSDARLLLMHAAGVTASALFADPARPLEPEAARRFAELIRRRAGRAPVSHLLGRREFWSREFIVGPAVLDPRPDSETLIEAALELLPDATTANLLDLGVGSGCLLLTVLAERPGARGVGVDLSDAAIRVARRNASILGVDARAQFYVGDWGAAVDGRFDLILCNPPYVATETLAALAPEVVRHEPRLALDGGADGLAGYRAVARHIPRLLAPTGFALVEAGVRQMIEIKEIFWAEGCRLVAEKRDLAGIARCAVFTPRAPAPRTAGREKKGWKPD